jgi:hypothetical protein
LNAAELAGGLMRNLFLRLKEGFTRGAKAHLRRDETAPKMGHPADFRSQRRQFVLGNALLGIDHY